jgi:HD-GYP domain-containing protein (c-di-GMP phosphodiesterase class II)/DNA-binding CsgD family transcriptional regulator
VAEVRLAELVAALSLGVDLGFGQPMEHVLRECMIALRLADRIGLDEAERSTVYYTGLLVGVGCHADAHEQAKWFGDDIALKSTKYDHDFRSLRAAASMISLVGSGNPPLHRFRVGLEFAVAGRRDAEGMVARHAAMATALAERLGLPPAVQESVGSSYEQWDGKGWPVGLAGDQIPVAARLAQFSEFIEVAHRVGGNEAAVALAEQRRGKQFDPTLSAVLCADPEEILGELDSSHTWSAVIDAEPALRVTLKGDSFDSALRAVADFVDLKSPYTLGHARAVAELAAVSAEQLGEDSEQLRRAGLVHDLGRLGVSNAIWDKPGPLGAGEWERVRLHPYLTERMLHQSAALAPLAEIAVQHRERLDGSGYPKGLSGGAITRPARILGAVDAYRSMREPRPFRPPLSEEQAAAELQADARAGKLDAEAVAAVLAAAGHSVGRRREWPAGLTTREVDVLRLVARGLSSKQIATELVITPKTARNHIEHIYTKIDASSRVAASLFATEHGLI